MPKISVKNNLINSVTLPYQSVKGSFDVRQQKSEQFTRKIMSELSGQIIKKEMSLSEFGRSLKKITPSKIDLFVKKNTDKDSYAQLNRIFAKDGTIVKQSLEIEPNEKNRINILNVPTITHEIRHLADSLYHPKIMARDQLMAKKNLDTDKFLNFYDNDIYVMEMGETKRLRKDIIKDIKQNTKKAMRGFSAEDKLNMLQFMRYSLISEKNAYNDERKIAKKLFKKNLPVYDDALQNQTKEYMFDEKIKLFRDMAFELIKKERGIHRANITKS